MTAARLAALLLTLSAATAGAADRQHINLPNRPITAPFSDAVRVGDTLYIAGRLGFDPKTGQPPEDPAAEARLALDGIRDVLAAAGMKMEDLVMVQVFCPDVKLYDAFNQAYRGYFPPDGPYPARAFVGSGPLLRGGRFEVNGIAVRADSGKAGKP